MTKCLVLYGTKYGSTREVALVIADVLKADIADVANQPDIGSYDVVVLGSPVYAGDYLDSVVQFIKANEGAFRGRKVGAFITAAADMEWDPGLTGEEDELLFTQQDYADGLAKITGGEVLAAKGFGGRLLPDQLDDYDRKMLGWFYQHLMKEKLKGFDLIDLETVRQWAEELRRQIG
jgi:menaquinone-dependent protoporphyrinogen IX oxidase